MPLKVDEVCIVIVRRVRETADLLGNDKGHGNELTPDPRANEHGSSGLSNE